MSDTPRTDSATLRDGDWVSADFARELERELAAWKAYAERMEQAGDAIVADGLNIATLSRWHKAREGKP